MISERLLLCRKFRTAALPKAIQHVSFISSERKTAFEFKTNSDARGSFTELLKTKNCGQFSVNVSLPGITKGEHWHNSKWEQFIVVSGKGLYANAR